MNLRQSVVFCWLEGLGLEVCWLKFGKYRIWGLGEKKVEMGYGVHMELVHQ